ncbi:PH domain-containing protein [Streptomyces sp. 184]|uniref:PH domain-containing protein n=1 Tax=Streptomyces sp. 184 TaxID=1827526 RepID=UPI003891AADF
MDTLPVAEPTPDQEREPEHGEMHVRLPRLRVERRAVLWWMLRALLQWGLLLSALVVTWVLWEPARVWVLVPATGVAAVLAVKLAVEPWWRYRVHRWEFTEQAAYASSGWLVREWRVAPTSRIQTVDAVRGPLEQFLGLSTLRVTTASSSGAIAVQGLDRRTAEEAATRLAAVAELVEGDAT